MKNIAPQLLLLLTMVSAPVFGQSCDAPCAPKKAEPVQCKPDPCDCPPCPKVCFEPGYPTKPSCTPCAYNIAAAYELGPNPWEFWFDASFTYWIAYQDGMDLGVSTTEISTTVQDPQNAIYLFQDTEYEPGFKVGLGMSLDHDFWSGYLEYTWFRSAVSTSSQAPADARGGTAVWSLSNWYSTNQQVNTAASSLETNWKVHMDVLDGMLTRPYYQGTHLIISPFGGMRGQWIRQSLRITPTIFTSSGSNTAANGVANYKSHSWAIGPRVGFNANWHLGAGFRFVGDMAGSLLYTRYTRVAASQGGTTPTQAEISARFSDYNALRASNEFNAGIGWGSYLDCQKYHFDLLATYDFQVLWNENMLRQVADAISTRTGHAPSNLYLHGLTVKAKFDF